jgi:dolichol-phosphate mannosyltransferase
MDPFAKSFGTGATRPATDGLRLSVVVPMLNEEGAAAALVAEIATALGPLTHEIVVVDDGSTDGTLKALEAARPGVPQLRIVAHGKNAGQSRATLTGVLAARAPIVATLDGDGQNDPRDILALYERLVRDDAPSTLAMVSGVRMRRADSASKRFGSRVANRVRRALLKDGAEDTGCGLKVFWRDAFLRLPAFDHMHRYLPALMRREGFLVEFAPVSHRPRASGRSKYTNLGRLAVAVRDLFGVMWLLDRARSPGEISEL